MIYILSGIVLLFTSTVFALSPSRLSDGKPEIAVAEVNKVVCWTEKEKADAISYAQESSTEPLTVVDFTPTDLESAWAESGIKFENYSEFLECISSKEKSEEKIADLKPSVVKSKTEEIQAIQNITGK